jgi:uncharacterized protein (DUF302 family)
MLWWGMRDGELNSMNYGLTKTTDLSYDAAIVKVTDELKKEGFGILTTIDVQETLRQKLNVTDFPRYIILGACNPPFAHQSLKAEEQIGLLLPCNVIVYEKAGRTVVAAFDPNVMTAIIDNPALPPVAREIQQRLQRVIDAL